MLSFLSNHFFKNKVTQNKQRYNRPPEEEKQFSRDIGEYVTYEEVKDEDDKKNQQ